MPALRRPRHRFETRNPDAAIEFMETMYGAHSLRLRRSGPMHMRLEGFDVAGLNLSTVSYGIASIAELTQERDCWVFAMVARGGTEVAGRLVGVGDAGALRPDALRPILMSTDLELINLRVPTHDLVAAGEALLGHAVERDLAFPDHVESRSTMANVLGSLVSRLIALPAYSHPAAAALERRWQEAALFEIFMTWPHAYSQALDQVNLLPQAIQRGRDYIVAHAHHLPGLTEVAAAAGIGVRALTRGFEKWLGMSPMRYAAMRRLELARSALRDSVGGATVTSIAMAAGFGNLGDFAASYRRRYGELPSETLRRNRPT